MPLPKTIHGVVDDVEEEEETREQVEKESRDDTEADEAPRGHMHPQLQREFKRLAVL